MAKDPIVRIKADTSQFDGKVDKAKKTLQKFGSEGGQASKALGELGKALGSEFGVLTKFAGAAGVASAALKVLKDAFFSSEKNIDEWGRITKASEGAYKTFVNALNTQNWNSFFTTLNEAIGGAAELYNMFDRLGSMKVNNSVLIATLEGKLAELRLLKQQGKNVDEDIKSINKSLSGLRAQEVAQGKAANRQGFINTLVGRGVDEASAAKFWDIFKKNGQSTFDYFEKKYKKLGSKYMKIVKTPQIINGVAVESSDEQWVGTENKEALYDTYKAFVTGESELAPFIQGYANAVREGTAAKMAEFKYNKWGQGGKTGGNGGGKTGGNGGGKKANGEYINYIPTVAAPMYNSISSIDARVAELQKLQNGATTFADYQKYGDMINRANMLKSIQFGSVGFGAMNIPKEIKTDTDEQGTEKKPTVVEGIGDLVNGVQGMTNSLNQMGIDIPEGINKGLGVLSGILGLVSSVCTILTAIKAIDAADAILPDFLAKGGVIRAARGFANVVPGNFMSGDRVPAMLNSGELVLNRAQTNNLAAQLSNGGLRNLKLETYASGRALRIVMNNDSQSRGMGRLVMN